MILIQQFLDKSEHWEYIKKVCDIRTDDSAEQVLQRVAAKIKELEHDKSLQM